MAQQRRISNLAKELGKRQPFTSLQQETYLNLVRTHEQLSNEMAMLFKQHGLSNVQYNALRILRGENTPMQIYQIAERMISAQTDISRLIDRLHTAGLVSRDRCGEDGRVVWISLTDKAKALLKKIDRPLMRLHDSQFSDLSRAELEKLNKLLYRSR